MQKICRKLQRITEKLKNKKHSRSHPIEITSKPFPFLRSFFFFSISLDWLAFYIHLFCDIIHSLVYLFLKAIIIFDRVQVYPLHKGSHPVAGSKFSFQTTCGSTSIVIPCSYLYLTQTSGGQALSYIYLYILITFTDC